MAAVFISYSHLDSKIAEEIASVLSHFGVEYFLDCRDVEWGESIKERVCDGIRECIALLVIVSAASRKSEWVLFEIGHASALKKDILPYLIHPLEDLPDCIQGLKHLDSLDEVRHHFRSRFAGQADADRFGALRQQMPQLFADMKNHLEEDTSGFVREFVVSSRKGAIFGLSKRAFMYYEDQHPFLREKIDLLEESGFISDVTSGEILRYRMTEEFIQLLKAV